MDKNMIEKNEEVEIDLLRVFSAVLRKGWLVGLVAVACAILTLLGTFFFITPKYEASAKFYVNNSSISVGGASVSISSGDLLTSRSLVDSYIVILKTRETLNAVIDYAGVSLTYKDVEKMITAEAVNETEIFQVTITCENPQESEKLANAIAYILPKRISTIIEGTSAKVVEAAVVPVEPSSPSYAANTLIGFGLGLMITAVIIALCEIFDVTVRGEEDVSQSCNYPILASVPDMTVSGKGGSYAYGYGSDRKKAEQENSKSKQSVLIGADIGFLPSEAYKLLRTKLQFSFAGEGGCRVIGISSAMSGEGKSLTAVNLAFTLSELGKKVILLDCDMRRPTLAEKLNINKKPGFSSYLTGQSDLADLVQYCGIANDEKAFHVITAGQNPPNPVELLSSGRMSRAIEEMRRHYDYVIMDLPPVGEVTDAMAVVDKVDGMLLVVRQNYCNRVVLTETIRQFEFVNTNILGIVLNVTAESEGKYGKKYYKRYARQYGAKYAEGAKSAKQNEN